MVQGLLVPKEEPPEYKLSTTYSPVNIVPTQKQQYSSITLTNTEITLPNSKSPCKMRTKSFLTPQQQPSATPFLKQRFHNDTINNNNTNNTDASSSCEGPQLSLSNNSITSSPDKNNSSIQQTSNNISAGTNVKSETTTNEAIANSLNNNMLPPHTLPPMYKTQTGLGMSPSSNSSTVSTILVNNPDSRPAVRRRVRRKANSMPDDQTEQLTEMSVRGLNLFRYASISDGVYQCTECAKDNIQKTFKNKYSFQRHAFLYHEGTQRKVFPCPVCGKEFSRPDKMKNHMKTTHECYMPRDCTYPLNLLINTSTDSMSTEIIKMPKMEFMSSLQ